MVSRQLGIHLFRLLVQTDGSSVTSTSSVRIVRRLCINIVLISSSEILGLAHTDAYLRIYGILHGITYLRSTSAVRGWKSHVRI